MYHRKQFLLGVKSGIPVMIGFLPITLTYATLAIRTGLSVSETNVMSIFLLAGASQMMALNMMSIGAGIFEIVLATFILNLRHLIMSICVMNELKETPTGLKLLLSFGITDESFAIFSTKPQEQRNGYFFAGLAVTTYLSWIVGTIIGSMLAQFLPLIVLNSISISLYAMFIGLLLPNIKKDLRIGPIVLIGILLNTLLRTYLSSGWAIIISTVVSAYLGTYFITDTKEDLIEVNE